jgi:hypothetical protein
VFRRYLLFSLAFILAAGLFSAPPPANAGSGDTRMRISLTGPVYNGSQPSGSAEYRARTDGRFSFNIDVSGVNLPDYTLLPVKVNGVFLINLSMLTGRAGGEMDSKHGLSRRMKVGDIVTVYAPDGTLLVSGRF